MTTEIEGLYQQHKGVYIIELVLSDVRQLFNSFDPSPFREKSLDKNAEEYIYNAVGDIPLPEPVRLVVYLPAVMSTPEIEEAITSGIRNHFAILRLYADNELRRLSRRGRRYLLIGIAILLLGVLFRQVMSGSGQYPPVRAIEDILLIISWVAIWEPVHIFLYERSPVRERMEICDKISGIEVVVRPHHDTITHGFS